MILVRLLMFSSGYFRRLDGSNGRRSGRQGSGSSTAERSQPLRLYLFRYIHCMWFFLHTQSFYWSNYRQLQHAQKESK